MKDWGREMLFNRKLGGGLTTIFLLFFYFFQAININDYLRVNGFSNSYWAWGGEDDDMGLFGS